MAAVKVYNLSPAMAKVVGAATATRAVCMQKLWAYIADNKLKDEAVKHAIKMDATLAEIAAPAGVTALTNHSILSIISPNLIDPLADKRAAAKAALEEAKKVETAAAEAAQAAASKAHLCQGIASAPLKEVVGDSITIFAIADVLKPVWEYIKANKLQGEGRTIKLDDKLKALYPGNTTGVISHGEIMRMLALNIDFPERRAIAEAKKAASEARKAHTALRNKLRDELALAEVAYAASGGAASAAAGGAARAAVAAPVVFMA